MILLSNKEDKCHDRQEHLFDIIIAKTPRERHVGDTIVIGKNHVHWDMSFMIPFTIDKNTWGIYSTSFQMQETY